MNTLEKEALYKFLLSVDQAFPIPLSCKVDLWEYTCKLVQKATLCIKTQGEGIVGLVAGYTEDLIDNMAYIAVAAVAEKERKKGIARELIVEFINICRQKQIERIHLYAVSTNIAALKLYDSLGFEVFTLEDEVRPMDVHLILKI